CCRSCGLPCKHSQVQEPQHTHNQSHKWHRNGIKKPQSQKYESLKGIDLKFLRNMYFSKKYNKKGLKKIQANNAKAVSAGVVVIEAPVKPKAIKPRCQSLSHKLSPFAFIDHPELHDQGSQTLPTCFSQGSKQGRGHSCS
ncbi:mCG122564, partial [Mus musculus]